MTRTTEHFKNCLGVFQGGGCKALALVGAYSEATERGVFFSEVAGTSAGSIIAALIAAGATPKYIENAIYETNFLKFKHPPTGDQLKELRYLKFLLKVGPAEYEPGATFIENLGIFSSKEIEDWLESHLRKLLGIGGTAQVKFKDLLLPLHVIATELGKPEPAVWSLHATPNDSVAYAVRCSCTIPIFFQPVDNRFVDGGIVSNLPSFALNRNRDRNYEKILCFAFNLDEQITQDGSKINGGLTVKSYLLKLISAVIDGAVNIQSELQGNLHFVKIGHLPLGTVDFGLINKDTIGKMLEAGVDAAKRFFDAEIAHVHGDVPHRLLIATSAEALNQIVREECRPNDDLFLAFKSTRYVYNIFPSLLHWATKGVKLTFFTTGSVGDDHEEFRRLILKRMGARVLIVDKLPLQGALFRSVIGVGNAIILSEDNQPDSNCFAAKYDGTYDSIAIRSMFNELERCIPSANVYYQGSIPKISIEQGGLDFVIQRLRLIQQYGERAKFSLENVNVKNIRFLTKYVKSYKYTQIRRIFQLYDRNGLDFFECSRIVYKLADDEIEMPMTPPVAEQHDGAYYLIEGNSRLTYLIREKKATEVKMLVVRDVKAPLPSSGHFGANAIVISDQDKVGSVRYDNWNGSHYRKIEETVRHPSLYLETENVQ